MSYSYSNGSLSCDGVGVNEIADAVEAYLASVDGTANQVDQVR